MRIASLIPVLAASAALAAPAPTPSEAPVAGSDITVPTDPLEALKVLESLGNNLSQQVQAELSEENLARRGSGCTLSKLQIRREWGSLSKTQRQNYIKAVQCLMAKSPNTPASESPGTKSRFDDFIAVHINQTMQIHYTGNFLSWHRYFTWLYEKALREECGYTGSQPYWNWGLTAITGLEKSPIFDGSDSSMSGNGEYIANKGNITLGAGPDLPPIILPTGSGGGCITSGPFKDMSVNLGPVSLDTPNGVISNSGGPMSYNPRCLRRDLTNKINQDYASPAAILRNIINPTDIDTFQMQMQGVPGSGNIGVHGGGHYSMGGDPGRDFFTSPGDPAFYLHHSMIDRVWWMWQALSPSSRTQGSSALAGTRMFMDPTAPKTTLEDIIDIGYAAGTNGQPLPIKDLLSTISGPFCYIYL